MKSLLRDIWQLLIPWVRVAKKEAVAVILLLSCTCMHLFIAICGCRWHAHTCYVIGIWISLWVCVCLNYWYCIHHKCSLHLLCVYISVFKCFQIFCAFKYLFCCHSLSFTISLRDNMFVCVWLWHCSLQMHRLVLTAGTRGLIYCESAVISLLTASAVVTYCCRSSTTGLFACLSSLPVYLLITQTQSFPTSQLSHRSRLCRPFLSSPAAFWIPVCVCLYCGL